MTPLEIADIIAAVRNYHTVVMAGGIAFSHPLSRELIKQRIDIPDKGFVHTARRNHPHHVKALDFAEMDEEFSAKFNIMLLRSWPSFMVLQAADPLIKYLPSDKRPEFEFLRHIRNAVAHDGRFSIKRVSFPAQFDGYEITLDLNGTPLWDFLQPGDLLALLTVSKRRSGGPQVKAKAPGWNPRIEIKTLS